MKLRIALLDQAFETPTPSGSGKFESCTGTLAGRPVLSVCDGQGMLTLTMLYWLHKPVTPKRIVQAGVVIESQDYDEKATRLITSTGVRLNASPSLYWTLDDHLLKYSSPGIWTHGRVQFYEYQDDQGHWAVSAHDYIEHFVNKTKSPRRFEVPSFNRPAPTLAGLLSTITKLI